MIRKKKDFTKYEKQFSDLLIKSVQQHTENAEPPQIDYSFLNEDEPVRLNIVRKRAVPKALARVSVILIVFFVGISVALVTDMPGTASAWKAQMARRLYVLKEGFVSSDPNMMDNYTEVDIEKIVFDDYNNLEKARNVAPGLPMLEYIPNGYSFKDLVIYISYDETYNAMYEFVNKNDKHFSINIYYNPEIEHVTTNILDVIEIIEEDERTICIWKDPIEDNCGVTITTQSYTATILGDIDNEALLTIAESLN